jgi:hypothetical protein
MSNSNPGLVYGQVPTAAEWNSFFTAKQDWNAILDQIIQQGGAPSFVAPTAWTPTDGSGASLTFTSISAEYSVVGNIVLTSATLTYPTTANSASAIIGGLPYATANKGYAVAPDLLYVIGAAAALIVTVENSSTAAIFALASGSAVTNATLSGKTVSFQLAYPLT